jgi:abortive infection bacteriophage resistance protein
MPNQYRKQPLSSAELLALLKSRNLLIPDEERATRYLDSIGYYRLSGYMYPLQSADRLHRFAKGTRFNDIVDAYKFDKRLRAIVMEYMERVEVVLRAKLTNYYSLEYGFFWYTDENLIDRKYKGQWQSLLDQLQEDFKMPKELFLRTFKRNYPDEAFPPSQMALETLSLGELARLFRALLTDKPKLQIAAEFRQAPTTLDTWFLWLANVRNICAHHGRLWNRIMSADRPTIPGRKQFKFPVPMPDDANTTMYGAVALIDHLLKCFNPDNHFTEKVEELIREYQVNATLMGFPAKWETTAVWHH